FEDDTAKFGGLSFTVSQGLFEVEGEGYHRLTAALRGSYLRDQGGSRTGLDQALGEVTATLGVNFLRDASLRVDSATDAYGSVSLSEYDRVGNLLTSVDALGGAQYYTYDAL